MNILILSASTGGGHMRASKAIENYMIQQGENINVEIVDSLLYISPILNKTITSGYLYLATKTPKLYGKLYDLTNKEHKLANFVARLNNIFANTYFENKKLNNESFEIQKEKLKNVFYPCEKFWSIATQYDIKVLYGIDPHHKGQILLWYELIELANEIIGKETIKKLSFIEG